MRDIALVFSHDLKEPVQQIARLTRRAQVDDDSRDAAGMLKQVLECADRASDMLDGMLEYLTVTSRDSTPTLVDLNACFERALGNLAAIVEESDADVAADQLPMVVGDEYQILHLFQNLLSNAIKFRGRERPRVRVEVEQRGSECLLAVRDNGIGIAEPYTQRIFEMGQRLHTRDEYPGTGIGLTLCKRIVERHGGRIWAESRDGGGSTFYILLPCAPSHVTRMA
jgi:light-regulated signal transduction histidine kinase (bacteriophytochrome)